MESASTCPDCGAAYRTVTLPMRLVQEGHGTDATVEARFCPADDRHAGLVMGKRPRRLASGGLRRLADWGAEADQTRAKGLVAPAR